MASGHVNRINRPNTWLHRPMLHSSRKSLPTRSRPHMALSCRDDWLRPRQLSGVKRTSRIGPTRREPIAGTSANRGGSERSPAQPERHPSWLD